MTVRAAAIRFSMKSRMGAGVLALVLLFVALWLGAAIGETSIPLDVVAKTVANRLWYAGYPLDPIDEGIVWSYRLSRAVVAACCGAALALSGVVLQSLLRNSLADPYILGISAGASTGRSALPYWVSAQVSSLCRLALSSAPLWPSRLWPCLPCGQGGATARSFLRALPGRSF